MPSKLETTYAMKRNNFALIFLLPLALATSACKSSSKITSPTVSETQRLYSLPPSFEVEKGTIIQSKYGAIVVPSDQRLYSQGAYMEQVERAIRP